MKTSEGISHVRARPIRARTETCTSPLRGDFCKLRKASSHRRPLAQPKRERITQTWKLFDKTAARCSLLRTVPDIIAPTPSHISPPKPQEEHWERQAASLQHSLKQNNDNKSSIFQSPATKSNTTVRRPRSRTHPNRSEHDFRAASPANTLAAAVSRPSLSNSSFFERHTFE